jgi:membrane-bound metal-dependent hydrolase YbcI (DUF457 family)
MPLAVTHVILTIIALDIYRDYFLVKKKLKKLIPLRYIFYGGVAGLLPDIDIPLTWLVNNLGIYAGDLHRLFTHSIFFPLIFLTISYIFYLNKNNKLAVLFGIFTFGTFFHIFLDYLLSGGVMLLYPLSNTLSGFDILGKLALNNAEAALDAFILLGWLWHEEKRHKISDYI